MHSSRVLYALISCTVSNLSRGQKTKENKRLGQYISLMSRFIYLFDNTCDMFFFVSSSTNENYIKYLRIKFTEYG